MSIRHSLEGRNSHVVWHEFGAMTNPPVVLLHGGHGSWQHWDRNVDALAHNYLVLVPNMPGYGDSDAPPEPSMDSLVSTMRMALDERIGTDSPVRLVGFSFGGLVAAKIAAQRPSITHLVLLAAAGHGTVRRPKGKLLNWKDALNANDHSALRQVMHHNLLMHMLANETAIDDQAIQIHTSACLQTRFHSKKISHAGGLLESLTSAGQVNPAMAVSALWGEHDVTCTPAAVLALLEAQRKLAHSHIAQGAGHWVQFEAADAVNTFLLKAL